MKQLEDLQSGDRPPARVTIYTSSFELEVIASDFNPVAEM